MAEYFLKLPKMGEGVEEATITSWQKNIGDKIEIDDSIVEIATDKVDSDVVSEVEGELVKKKFDVNDVVKTGDIIAIIETDKVPEENQFDDKLTDIDIDNSFNEKSEEKIISDEIELIKSSIDPEFDQSLKYYSPLVKSIAIKEGLTNDELEKIKGTGKDKRITKNDIISYLSLKKGKSVEQLINPFEEDNEDKIKSDYNVNSSNFSGSIDLIL